MDKSFPYWMWSEACEMLARAERLHQQLFQPQSSALRQPSWRPPVDILETEDEVLVFIALPGVDPDEIDAAIESDELVIAGVRVLPAAFRTAAIHRLELPQGRFERRIRLPAGQYRAIRWSASQGCLLIRLDKTGEL
ncbi:MAG: Hsp20/alpha crystallin family protein [Hyphomicrobiaceae bacterium]|nr:Hsp20/alpha crystallin family protein [Hyphomicrobiaceae bacterium]